MGRLIIALSLVSLFTYGQEEVIPANPYYFNQYVKADTLKIGDSTYTNDDFAEFRDNFENTARTIYVSQYVGNDTTGNGSDTLQFRTVLKAAQNIQAKINNVEIIIQLDSGTYSWSGVRNELNKKSILGEAKFTVFGTREEIYTNITVSQTNNDLSLIDVVETISLPNEYCYLGRSGNFTINYPIHSYTANQLEVAQFSYSSSNNEIFEIKTIIENTDNTDDWLNISLAGNQTLLNGNVKFSQIVFTSSVTTTVNAGNKFELRGVVFDLSAGSQTSLNFNRLDPIYVNGLKVLTNGTSRAGLDINSDHKGFLYAISIRNTNASRSSNSALVISENAGFIRGLIGDNYDNAILLVGNAFNNGGFIKAENCNHWLESDKDYYQPKLISANGTSTCRLIVENVDNVFKLDGEMGYQFGTLTQVGTTTNTPLVVGLDTTKNQYPYIYIELDTIQ